MAIFHFELGSVNRGRGQSAVAAAAYRSCARLEDNRTGLVSDFTRKGGYVDGGVFGWDRGSETLWNAAEAKERHPRAVIARQIDLALPHELSPQGRFRLSLGFCLFLRDRHGVAGQFDIHAGSNDPRNVHCHVMMTTRVVDGSGIFGAKTRELDCKPSSGLHVRALRAEWERRVNAALAREGLAERIDGRSLAERGTHEGGIEPMEHLGPARAEAERRGLRTAAGDRNRRRAMERAALQPLLAERQKLDEQIAATMRSRQKTRSPSHLPTPMSDGELESYVDRMIAPKPTEDRIPVAASFIGRAQAEQPTGWSEPVGRRIMKVLRKRRNGSAQRLAALLQEAIKRSAVAVTEDVTRFISMLAQVLTRDERDCER